MPQFGDFETIGEPIRLTEVPGHVSVLWRARRAGTENSPNYVVKLVTTRVVTSEDTQPTPAGPAESEQTRDFLEGVRQLQKASSQDARFLARIHATGVSDSGSWCVTDLYPRKSLQEYINLQGGVESRALQHVVYCVAAGCLALQRASGRSHGNLKASNVLLAGKPQVLRRTPLHLIDPRPLRVSTGRPLPSADEANPDLRVRQQTEKADLRGIGELILQLVEGRIIRSGYDYNYPVPPSPAWERLGKDADHWRQRCNQLLRPQLKLRDTSLEALENELRPRPMEVYMPRVLVAAAAVAVLAAALFYLLRGPSRPSIDAQMADKRAQWQRLVNAAREHEKAENWRGVGEILGQALVKAQELNDGEVAKQTQNDLEYAKALAAGAEFRVQGKADEARKQAERALLIARGDHAAAEALKNWADAQDEEKRVEVFQRLISEARQAEAQDQWGRATNLLQQAVVFAGQLKETSPRQLAAQELRYAQAIEAGERFLKNSQWQLAYDQAQRALSEKPSDEKAETLRSRARLHLIARTDPSQAPPPERPLPPSDPPPNKVTISAQEAQQAQLDAAVRDAQNALNRGEYAEAIRKADAALAIRADDATASRIKLEAQSEQKFLAAFAAAQAAFEQGDYPRAIQQADAALGLHKGDAKAAKLKRDAQSEQAFQSALATGQAAFTRGEYGRAIQQAEAALAIHNNHPKAARLKLDAQTEQTFQAALAAAQSAFDQADYLKAVEQAEAALRIHDRHDRATRLRTAAQEQLAKRDVETNYLAALASGRAAFEQREYARAIQQADTALRIKPGATEAIQLKQSAQQEQNYLAANNALMQGDYPRTAAACQPYRGVDRFDRLAQQAAEEQRRLAAFEQELQLGAYGPLLQTSWPDKRPFNVLKTQAATENRALEDAAQKLGAGDYTFVASLSQQSFATKAPFKLVLDAARREANLLRRLQGLKDQNQRQALQNELAALSAEIKNKRPFAELADWAASAPVASARDVALSEEKLASWEMSLGLKPRTPGSNVTVVRDPAKDAAYYLDKIDKVEAEFSAAGVLDADRQRRINALRWRIRGGSPPPGSRQ